MTDLRQRETGPRATDRLSDAQVGASASASVPRQVPALHEMTPRGREVATAYYEAGCIAGAEMERRRYDAELAAEWDAIKAAVMPSALADDVAQMAERRGQPERAAAARRLWQQRGVA